MEGESTTLSIFTRKLHRRYSLGFWKRLCLLKTLQTFNLFRVFNIIRLLKSVSSLKYFTSFNLERKLRIFEIVILNTKWKTANPAKTCVRTISYKKFYAREIIAVSLSKSYLLKNTKKTCKPNNRDLNLDWKILIFI